jgi:hypothetical protein
MKRALLLLLVLGALAVAVGLPLQSAYLKPRRALVLGNASLQADIDKYRSGEADHRGVLASLRGYADRTLGGDLESVDHELRTRLNRIGEELGLQGLSVGTGRVRPFDSPGRAKFVDKSLRDETDFVEVEGWISGEAGLDAALQVLHRVESEPWIKRIQEVRFQPRDNGARFALTLRLATLFLPGRGPSAPPPRAKPVGFEPYQALAARNPFRLPDANVPPPAPPPAPSPMAELSRWVLTGVANGPVSAEVWLLNSDSKESRRLSVGEHIEQLVLVGAAGEVADFELSGVRVRVSVGSALSAGVAPGR